MSVDPNSRLINNRFTRSQRGMRLLHILEPSKWWTIIFALGAIAIITWTLTIYKAQARDEATHEAEIVANADGQYNQCVASIPVLSKINGFIAGDRIIRNTLVKNSYGTYISTPRSSGQYEVRKANWLRLRQARVAAYQVKFPVPSQPQCAARRAQVFKQAHERVPPLPRKPKLLSAPKKK